MDQGYVGLRSALSTISMKTGMWLDSRILRRSTTCLAKIRAYTTDACKNIVNVTLCSTGMFSNTFILDLHISLLEVKMQ